MKRLFTLLSLLAISIFSFAQNTGDVAIIGMNSDTPDKGLIVTFVDLPAGTTLYFTDNSWDSTAFTTNEGFATLQLTSDVLAGSVIEIDFENGTVNPDVGTISLSGNFALSTSGDHLYLYLGTDETTPTTFLFAVNTKGGWADGELYNTGLTDSVNALTFPSSTDDIRYIGPRSGLDVDGYKAAIADVDNNWETSGSAFTFDLTSFDLGGTIVYQVTNVKFYPNDQIIVTYNAKLDTADAGIYKLLTGSDVITFGSATLSDDSLSVILSSPSVPYPNDGILDTLIDTLNTDTVELYAGFVPINYLNAANETVVQNGMLLAIKGIVVADNNYRHVVIADAPGAYHSIYVYDNTGSFPGSVEVGDSVVLLGTRTVYNDMTELLPVELVYNLGAASMVIEPAVIPSALVDTNVVANDPNTEPYEGVLVKVENLIYSYGPDNYGVYTLLDTINGYGVKVDDLFDYQYGDGLSFAEGHVYNVAGILTYSYGLYRINPRGLADVEEVVTNVQNASQSVAIYPNPVSDLLVVKGVKAVMIYDNTGRLLKKMNVDNIGQINVSDLAAGIYTVKYITTDGQLGATKIIKK